MKRSSSQTRRVAARAPHFRLIVADGPRAGTVFPLILKETLVGRIDSAHLVLEDVSVSRLHARLTLRADGVHVEDLHSLEGTWVNGLAIAGATRLADGDQISFGDVVLAFAN